MAEIYRRQKPNNKTEYQENASDRSRHFQDIAQRNDVIHVVLTVPIKAISVGPMQIGMSE